MRFRTSLAYIALLALCASPASSQDSAKRSLRYGLEAPRSVSNVILLNTLNRMKAAGYAVEIIDFNSPETMTLALQNGDVDFVSTSAGTAFALELPSPQSMPVFERKHSWAPPRPISKWLLERF
jgi:ABC-type nitrate/sulfonate/bicarbonate transport system substrate-binding protein